jgi:deazaflavin-dependent oxidoreductase (nitroreductase family)
MPKLAKGPAKVTIQLTTTGRKSGRSREVTLYAYPDGDDFVVVGSWGGAARDPAWARNLRDAPKARVRHGKRDVVVKAREVKGSERDRLWDLVTEVFPLYKAYQKKTERVIPLFVLEPSDG